MKQTGKFCEYCVPQNHTIVISFVMNRGSRMITFYCKGIHALEQSQWEISCLILLKQGNVQGCMLCKRTECVSRLSSVNMFPLILASTLSSNDVEMKQMWIFAYLIKTRGSIGLKPEVRQLFHNAIGYRLKQWCGSFVQHHHRLCDGLNS